MAGQRRRRWSSIEPTLGHGLVFDGYMDTFLLLLFYGRFLRIYFLLNFNVIDLFEIE